MLRYGYYAVAMVVLWIYQLLTYRPISISTHALPAVYLLTLAVLGKLVWSRIRWGESRPHSLAGQQRRHFLYELSLYALLAAASVIASYLLFNIALSDALCGGIIIITFGYFAGVDTTLAASREWFRNGVEQDSNAFRLIPTSISLRRATLSIIVLILLFSLTAALKLYMGITSGSEDYKPAVIEFLIDQLFYFTLLAALMLRGIRSYSHNLHYILEPQLKGLRDAQAGEFEHKIPILSQNELGLMAMQLNHLVEYVHEREKVEGLLKRVVSPDIMEKLLHTDTETLKHGEEDEVAILFCDIRGFTEMSEATSSEEVILFLNTFFSELSEIVSRYNGIINKFMGDAILAIYRTEHPSWAIDNAMSTALDIAQRVHQFKLPDGTPPSAGIGIHFGKVVAGTIGSEHRYEYTFLGDAVNTANRLEGLSKRLNHPIIVSAEAYQLLSTPLKGELLDLGLHNVRGKSGEIHVYGGPSGSQELSTQH
jgi:class 3 adenylate cyclase